MNTQPDTKRAVANAARKRIRAIDRRKVAIVAELRDLAKEREQLRLISGAKKMPSADDLPAAPNGALPLNLWPYSIRKCFIETGQDEMRASDVIEWCSLNVPEIGGKRVNWGRKLNDVLSYESRRELGVVEKATDSEGNPRRGWYRLRQS